MPTIWIITGEASGDDYGAGLARALRVLDPAVVIRGMGAAKMREAGVDILVDSTELGIVGFVEVLKHIPFFYKLLKNLTARAVAERPDAVVMIDYPGFNIRFAQRLKAAGIPVIYYISPQVWAWKKGRIHTLATCVSHMLCIFPFEPEYYAPTGMPVTFVGHPLLETLAPMIAQPEKRDPNLVILLPGSRRSEYTRLMPVFMVTARMLHQQHPEYRFHIPLRNERTIAEIKQMISTLAPDFPLELFTFSADDARTWLRRGSAGIAASGTITVEAAILGLPLVVTYKINPMTWWLAKRIVKLPYITICNLVTRKQVFAELLQDEATPDHLAEALIDIMPNGRRRQEALDGMHECVTLLGGNRHVSATVATLVLNTCKGNL